MSIYRDYARVYDNSGQLAFSLRMIPYLNLLIERHHVTGSVMLDLACGTGTIAIAMAQAGWRVYGVDASAEMLAEARAKTDESGVQVTWSQQDMRQVVLPEQAHLVTCLYDSMNYMLTDQDLLATFRSVSRLLQPGGLFLFDMNTAWVMASIWDDEIYFTDSDDLSMIMQSEYDRKRQRTTVVVTCFERVGDCYRKIVEEHQEQAYPPEHVATLLTDAGLHVEAMYDCFTLREPSPTTFRIMFVARKPS
ncbi:MAG: class I SAM-dependent methyltransferase [Chloroflexi bacterium]|jgi:ubiquinone/menaquinone biosynthesis C-methylase UbiE|nr:class I SAM-dependent methyltransferase [Chloroflexota bacterium]